VILLAGSGLRIGEARGLDVEDIDFLRRTVKVSRQRNQAGAIAA
jgi:integrase